MKIGVYFTATKSDGGVYQYSLAFLESLSRIKINDYIIITNTKSNDIPDKYSGKQNFKIINISSKSNEQTLKIRDLFSNIIASIFPGLVKVAYKLGLFEFMMLASKISQRNIIRLFEKQKFDLIFYPTSSHLSFLSNVPSVVTVHDLQHRVTPRFKEVSAGGRWEYREYGYKNISKKAFRIFVDSEEGKNQMVKFYPQSKGKIITLPYLAPSYLNPKISLKVEKNIKQKYSLPEKYIFYPAKFWPHKNHKNLIEALNILKKNGKIVDLVLTGSKNADFSSFDETMRLVERLGLGKQVHYLGLVSNEDLSVIYKLASALVMPTYFGPTNIPVLEAWKMGVPAIYSNIKGCREQLGEAGLLINPDNPHDIADKVWEIYTHPELADKLIKKGHVRVNKWGFDDFSKRIEVVLKDFERQTNVASKDN